MQKKYELTKNTKEHLGKTLMTLETTKNHPIAKMVEDKIHGMACHFGETYELPSDVFEEGLRQVAIAAVEAHSTAMQEQNKR